MGQGTEGVVQVEADYPDPTGGGVAEGEAAAGTHATGPHGGRGEEVGQQGEGRNRGAQARNHKVGSELNGSIVLFLDFFWCYKLCK